MVKYNETLSSINFTFNTEKKIITQLLRSLPSQSFVFRDSDERRTWSVGLWNVLWSRSRGETR